MFYSFFLLYISSTSVLVFSSSFQVPFLPLTNLHSDMHSYSGHYISLFPGNAESFFHSVDHLDATFPLSPSFCLRKSPDVYQCICQVVLTKSLFLSILEFLNILNIGKRGKAAALFLMHTTNSVGRQLYICRTNIKDLSPDERVTCDHAVIGAPYLRYYSGNL